MQPRVSSGLCEVRQIMRQMGTGYTSTLMRQQRQLIGLEKEGEDIPKAE